MGAHLRAARRWLPVVSAARLPPRRRCLPAAWAPPRRPPSAPVPRRLVSLSSSGSPTSLSISAMYACMLPLPPPSPPTPAPAEPSEPQRRSTTLQVVLHIVLHKVVLCNSNLLLHKHCNMCNSKSHYTCVMRCICKSHYTHV